MPTNKVHVGRNVKRFRELLGIKQEVLAIDLGDDWNQQKVSLLEQKEIIDVELLKQIAASLKVPVEALQNFDEERAVSIISNTFHDQATGNGSINNHNSNPTVTMAQVEAVCYPSINNHNSNPTFNINPLEKWLEAMEENKKLYERMLKEKNDLIATLHALVENIKR